MRRRRPPPRRSPLATLSAFLADGGTWVRIVVLATWCWAVARMVRETAGLMASADGRLTVLSAMFSVLSTILAAGLLAFASACALAVVRDVANGCATVVEWPGLMFLDWAGDALVIVNAMAMAVAPGAGLAWWMAAGDGRVNAAAVAPVVVLFPIVLLSLLENGSPWDPLSLPVWRTFVVAPAGWVVFFVAAAILLGAAGAVAVPGFMAAGVWGAVVASLAAGVAWLVYFHLVGALACHCARRTAAAQAATEAAEAEKRGAAGDDPAAG
ncbi:MAG: hypothetical protein ACKO5R_11285 [Planctomycetaceae bacterium]